jgi:hypothetical protein
MTFIRGQVCSQLDGPDSEFEVGDVTPHHTIVGGTSFLQDLMLCPDAVCR